MAKTDFKSIDDYIAGVPAAVQPRLQELREAILKAAPGAAETISYQMPAFMLGGRQLVYFAAWKAHIGLYALPSGNAAFAAELARYKPAKGSVRFPLSEPLPLDLISRIVKFRAEENRAKAKVKA